ncbi:DUF1015 domain-containing protein [bacterium]|nr:DUF1015 domain-containing protein [bacterium]
MVDVKPLNAIVYNQEKVNMTDVIAPPYDVILDDYREELYKRSDYNIVKLILAKGSTDTNDSDNRYENARKTFAQWLEEKVLIKLDNPTILYLLQKYKTANGKEITRKGFIARCKIEDFSSKKILPHEYTMGGPKQDRLNLTTACKANFSQIFMVYSDKQKQIENAVDYAQKPFIDVTDDLGVQNIVYKIDDEKTLNLISEVLKDKTLLIADGHHRYETAMNYRNLHPENEQAKYVMSYFTNMEDDLLIFPTHRIILRKIEGLLDKIKKYFDVKELSSKEELLKEIEIANTKQISMGLYTGKYYLLTLRENVDGILEEYKVPKVLRKLDLIVLHKALISKEFGYTDEEQMAQDGILYIKQEQEAFDMIDKGQAEASFIMAYPKIKDIQEISQAGERMPQKSTYFYPKLLSGIVINPLY